MNTLRLSVAGIRVNFNCAVDSLHEILRTRYTAFLIDKTEKAPAYEVNLHLDLQADPHTHISPDFSFEGPRIFFDLPGYVGFIDPARAAAVRIASDTPANAADYFLRVVFALLAYRAGGLMINAAGVVRNGRAFLFFGHSGAGKTTVARNSPQDLILNDDLIVLMPSADGWTAHGSPFTNPTQTRPSHKSAPAAALFRLVQSPKVYVEPLEGAYAMAELLASIPVLNGSPEPPLDRCQEILRAVPAYRLHLLPDASFWPLIEKL